MNDLRDNHRSRTRYLISIALIVVLTAVLIAWNPEGNTTAIVVAFMVIGVLLPEVVAFVTRRSPTRRN